MARPDSLTINCKACAVLLNVICGMSAAPRCYACHHEGCSKSFTLSELPKHKKHVVRCKWGQTGPLTSSFPDGGGDKQTPTGVVELLDAPQALEAPSPTLGKQLFVFKKGDAGAKGVARARESSSSDNGCAATDLLYEAMRERQSDVWRGQCNVPSGEGDGTGHLDLLRDFDADPSRSSALKPASPSAAFLEYDIRHLRDGFENRVLSDPRFSLEARDFDALSSDAFCSWRTEVVTYVRALFLDDGQEIAVIKTGKNFVVFGCRRGRHYEECKGAGAGW